MLETLACGDTLPMLLDLPLAAVMDVVRGAVLVLFVVSAFLVIIVILLQEGKGGGLAGAFGGAGAETFGVKAGTVNKFTAWLATMFLGLALLHAGLSTARTDIGEAPDTSVVAPPEDSDAPAESEEPANGGENKDEKPGGGN